MMPSRRSRRSPTACHPHESVRRPDYSLASSCRGGERRQSRGGAAGFHIKRSFLEGVAGWRHFLRLHQPGIDDLSSRGNARLHRLRFWFRSGLQTLKNIAEPVRVYEIARPQSHPSLPSAFKGAPHLAPSTCRSWNLRCRGCMGCECRGDPRVSFAVQRRCVRFAWRLSARS